MQSVHPVRTPLVILSFCLKIPVFPCQRTRVRRPVRTVAKSFRRPLPAAARSPAPGPNPFVLSHYLPRLSKKICLCAAAPGGPAVHNRPQCVPGHRLNRGGRARHSVRAARGTWAHEQPTAFKACRPQGEDRFFGDARFGRTAAVNRIRRLAIRRLPRGHLLPRRVEVHCLGNFRPDRCQSRRCR